MPAPQTYRQRYIAFVSDQRPAKKELDDLLFDIKKNCKFYPSPRLIIYDQSKGEGLIRCEHLQSKDLKRELERTKENDFEIKGVSGTIKKARIKFLNF